MNSIGGNVASGFGGVIAGHIINNAGKEIINEAVTEAMKVHNKTSLNVGEFITTLSGKSENQKYFVHCVCPQWGKANWEEILTKLIKEILIFWDKNKVESISFPPMSSGILGFPTINWANAFFTGIMDFLEGVDCVTWLNKLNVCIIEEDKHKEFMEKWIECYKIKYGDDDEPGSDEKEASEIDEESEPEEEKKVQPSKRLYKRGSDSGNENKQSSKNRNSKRASKKVKKALVSSSDSDSDSVKNSKKVSKKKKKDYSSDDEDDRKKSAKASKKESKKDSKKQNKIKKSAIESSSDEEKPANKNLKATLDKLFFIYLVKIIF